MTDVYKRQDVDYASNTTMYDHTVEEYPQMLYSADTKDIHHYGNTPYYNPVSYTHLHNERKTPQTFKGNI